MKRTALYLALAGCFAGPALAQSNVQIYGIIDVSLTSSDFGNGRTTRIQSAGMKTERIGFQGTEDLGGGLKANFRLETGYGTDTGNLDNGSAALGNSPQLFQREARVGLEGDFGKINVGRQYTPIFSVQSELDIFGVAGQASNYGLTGSSMTRMGNSARWNSKTYSGFSVDVGYSLGDAGDDNTAANGGANGESLGVNNKKESGRTSGLNLKYENGPLNLMYAFGTLNNAPKLTATTVATKANLIGASYDFKIVKVVGGYETIKNDAVPVTKDLKVWWLSGVVPFGNDFLLANVTKLSDKTDAAGDKDSTLFAIGWKHPLSKRSTLYGHYSRMNNSAKATKTIYSGGAISAVPAGGFDPSGFQFGINHYF